MVDDFQEIDGVGPAREEEIIESGYETYAELSEEDPEVLADGFSNLPEDSALEIIVQAQNLADLEEAEPEEDPTIEEPETETITETNDGTEIAMNVSGSDEGSDSESEDKEDESIEEVEETTVHTVEINLTTGVRYDALYDSLLSYYRTLVGRNSDETDRYTEYLDEVRAAVVGDTIEYEMTADEMNSFHNALREKRLDYQGKNLQRLLTPARELENEFNKQRRELIF